MRRVMMAGIALAFAPAAAAAQAGDSYAFRAGPQFVSYTVAGSTTSQIALPMVAVVPISSQFTIDIATAFASTTTSAGGASSSISGLTDTQVRANYAFGQNMVLTLGLNVPTGKSSVSNAEVVAAQAIGIDFFTYPVPSYGSGLGGTLGVAFAGSAGDWDLGAGASMRKSTEYSPLATGTASSLKYTPGDEYRVRLGGQRAIGSGRLALGLIFSAFGTPKINDTTTVNTGARAIAQMVFAMPVGSNELFITLWDLYTGSGKQLAGKAEASNVINVGLAYGIHAGSLVWEPNVEARMISQGTASGNMVFPGLRVRIQAGSWVIYPGASAAFGTVVNQSVSGIRGSLGVHWTP